MILVGQYDSPFARRVAVSLRVLGFAYEHDTRSVFGDFDSMRGTNPVGRIPSLVLDDGTTLIDSAAVLDWLDQTVGPERALVPSGGAARTQALQTIALATGVIEKVGAANYERLIRPAHLRWPQWIERCLIQAKGGLRALEAMAWPETRFGQVEISTGCMLDYIRLTDPALLPAASYPRLSALGIRCDARPEFKATAVADYRVPRG
jgi:glutathione S-transferase